jgi:hypothetical protein
MSNIVTAINKSPTGPSTASEIENRFNHHYYAADTVSGLIFNKGCVKHDGLQIEGLDDPTAASAY